MSGAVGAEDDTASEEMPESRAMVDLSKSTIAGGVAGMILGGLLGALLTLVVPNLGLWWGVVFGAVFGAGIGGAAGGMAVAKYNSPAWRETYESADPTGVQVGVHDGDDSVIDTAEEVMRRHGLSEISRE